MGRTSSTGVIRVDYVATITAPAAPTVAELTAGVDLTPWMTRDGLDTPLDGSQVDVAGANDRYNSTAAGSYGGQPVVYRGFRDKVAASDTAYATLAPGTTGYLVVRRMGGATGVSADAYVALQKVEVWPIEVMDRNPLAIADNEAQKFEAKCAVPKPPSMSAVVAA